MKSETEMKCRQCGKEMEYSGTDNSTDQHNAVFELDLYYCLSCDIWDSDNYRMIEPPNDQFYPREDEE